MKGLLIMDNQTIKDIFFNRADVEAVSKINCDNCNEQVVFLLQDKDHKFSIGLTTLLDCIAFAIKNGNLPKLPYEWLHQVDGVYGTFYNEDDDISYYNFKTK